MHRLSFFVIGVLVGIASNAKRHIEEVKKSIAHNVVPLIYG